MRVLVIEDDPGIASLVARALEQAGYTVQVEARGDTGFEAARTTRPDLVILDLMLPGMNGLEAAAMLRRESSTVPILMLTARDEASDRVAGLDAGADDYLGKPFDVQELLARVRAQLRRDRVQRARTIVVDDLEIDTLRRRVTRGDVEIGLSRREFDLLEALASREGRVLTRDIIQNSVWSGSEGGSNTVDVYIALLRKKVDGPFYKKLIHTVRNVGYCLEGRSRP